MNSFIKEMLKRNKEQARIDNIHNKAYFKKDNIAYDINSIYVGSIANNSVKNNITINDDALLIFVEDSEFMDIETGKIYKQKNLSEVHPQSKETYIIRISPLFYRCYETLKEMGIEPGSCFTVKQLREIYEEHSKRCARGC